MGFVKKIESEPGITGIWKLEEKSEDLIPDFNFSANEKIRYSQLKIEKRKREFLATRLLIEKLTGKKMELLYGEQGNPHLENNNLHISISHSAELVTVFLSETNCGIDTENVNRNTEKIASRFLTGDEIGETGSYHNPMLARIVYWSAKEAIYKCALEKEVRFNSQIVIHPFKIENEGRFRGTLNTLKKSASYDMRFFFFQNNVIVNCVEV